MKQKVKQTVKQNWIRGYLSTDDIKAIEQSVQKAEQGTSGEIVPMVVRQSSPILHLPIFLMFVFLSLFLLLEGPLVRFGLWPRQVGLWIPVILGLGFLGWLLSRSLWVQKVLTPNHDEAVSVAQRAELEFYRTRIENTRAHTGVLLFLSVMERRALVLADKAIADKVRPEVWNEVLHLLLSELKKGHMAEGFHKAIARCGEIMREHAPQSGLTPNELSNSLIIKDS